MQTVLKDENKEKRSGMAHFLKKLQASLGFELGSSE